jgi:hypothetical protein
MTMNHDEALLGELNYFNRRGGFNVNLKSNSESGNRRHYRRKLLGNDTLVGPKPQHPLGHSALPILVGVCGLLRHHPVAGFFDERPVGECPFRRLRMTDAAYGPRNPSTHNRKEKRS